MIKYLVLLFTIFLLLLQSCLGQHSKSSKNNFEDTLVLNSHVISINNITKAEYHRALDIKRYYYDTISVKKSEDELILNLAGNRQIILKDTLANTDNSDLIIYNYVGFFKEIGLYIVRIQYYETGEYMLVNYKTGAMTKMWGIPILAPDKKHIVTFSNALGYDVMPNGIQMWNIENEELKLMWEYGQQQWMPDGIVWVDNSMFYFLKIIPDFISKTNKQEEFYSAIKLKN